MTCLHPIVLSKAKLGWTQGTKVVDDGSGRFVKVSNLDAILADKTTGSSIEVPCGRCLACRKERSKAWALRIMMESLSWKETCFLTLTYDPEHVPVVPSVMIDENRATLPFSLDSRDLQLFWKRLRKNLDGRKIAYYAVGEYGDHTFRPHYHACVFGLGLFDRQVVEDSWQKGLVDMGDLTLASANYVAGYIQKKLYGDYAKEQYGNREFPFSRMSKGIGKNYFLENFDSLIRDGFVEYRGKKLPLPRYFWRLMSDVLPERYLKALSNIRSDDFVARDEQARGIIESPEWMIFKQRQIDSLRRKLEAEERLKARGEL